MALTFATRCWAQVRGQCVVDPPQYRLPSLRLVPSLRIWRFLMNLMDLQWSTCPHPQIEAMTSRPMLLRIFRLFEFAGLCIVVHQDCGKTSTELRLVNRLLPQDPLAA